MDRMTAALVFCTIHEQGSMAGAARVLGMSKAMVSRYLQAMETWTGNRLLHRSTRNLSLTTAGETALLHARELLRIAEDLSQADTTAGNVPSGNIRISCAQFTARYLLLPFIQRFLPAYPQTSIDLHISNQAVDLVEERIDLAVRITNDLDPNVIARPLGQCVSVLCASPGYLERAGTPTQLQQLSQHNCLMYSNFGKSFWHFREAGEPVAVEVRGNLAANESSLLLDATLAGLGISIQPWQAAAPYLATGCLQQLLPQAQPKQLGIYGIYRSRKHQSSAFQVFMQQLIAEFASDNDATLGSASDVRADVG
jgi:DNA-binding transcriptional LysR family regulator